MSNLQDPRVLLALERTVLAWNRSSLALIAFGFVIEKSAFLAQLVDPVKYADKIAFSKWTGGGVIVFGDGYLSDLGATISDSATFDYRCGNDGRL